MGEVLFPGVQIGPLSASSHGEAKLISMLGPLDTRDSALSLKETTAGSVIQVSWQGRHLRSKPYWRRSTSLSYLVLDSTPSSVSASCWFPATPETHQLQRKYCHCSGYWLQHGIRGSFGSLFSLLVVDLVLLLANEKWPCGLFPKRKKITKCIAIFMKGPKDQQHL